MKMIKSIVLIGLLMASTAVATATPRMATLDVQPNFDFGSTRETLRVHYSGVDDTLQEKKVLINIYKDTEKVHFFEVTTAKTEPKAYYFALHNAVAGQYFVEVCADTTCSEKNPALTKLVAQSDQKALTCPRGRDEGGRFVETEQISLSIIKADKFLQPSDFTAIENELTPVIKQMRKDLGEDYRFETEFTKKGFKKNPEYKKEEKLFYTGVQYSISTFKQLFEQKTKATQAGTIYTPDICERKYILTANVHLMEEATKEVKYRFKLALHLSSLVRYQYILKQDAKPIHVEMVQNDANIAAGSYKVLVAFCATEKDRVESTVCSDPIKAEQDLVVPAE